MILLVDNHDSFTFNLAHLLAEVSGIEPVVVRPEEVERAGILRRLADGEFDHVVIGPGPGSPHNDKDFKTAGQVIDASNKLPLLGVCLGHQGLGLRRVPSCRPFGPITASSAEFITPGAESSPDYRKISRQLGITHCA